MTNEDLGEYFIKNGEIYHCNSYTDRPTVNLKNIRTGENSCIVCDSDFAKSFNKLFEIPSEKGFYNLDKAKPVDHINLVDKESE